MHPEASDKQSRSLFHRFEAAVPGADSPCCTKYLGECESSGKWISGPLIHALSFCSLHGKRALAEAPRSYTQSLWQDGTQEGTLTSWRTENKSIERRSRSNLDTSPWRRQQSSQALAAKPNHILHISADMVRSTSARALPAAFITDNKDDKSHKPYSHKTSPALHPSPRPPALILPSSLIIHTPRQQPPLLFSSNSLDPQAGEI